MHNRIEIEIEDNRLFAQVAFLVDSYSFLDLVSKVKKKFKINSFIKDSDEWKNHFLNLAGFNLVEYKKMEKINPEDNDWTKKSEWLKERENNFTKHTMLQKEFFDSVTKIRRIHNYPSSFDNAIVQAILYNKVGEFKTTKALLTLGGMLPNLDKNDQNLMISLSPTSTKKEVIEAFNEAKELREEYELTNPLSKKLDKDTISTIKTVRDWHWTQLNGSTYEELVDNWNKNLEESSEDYIFDSNKVEQAVARYRRILQAVMSKTDI